MLIKGLEGASAKEIKNIESELKHICELIQTHRIKSGLTQEKLAEMLDVNVNTIKYIEQGRRIPSLPMLMRVCWKIGLDIKFSS